MFRVDPIACFRDTGSTRLRVAIHGWIATSGNCSCRARMFQKRDQSKTCSRDCQPAVRSCSRALPRLGHRGRGPAAGVLESLRAGVPGATTLPGSSCKSGLHRHRSTPVWPCTRCRSCHASASVPPAPAGGPIPASGGVVSWLACCHPLVSAVFCSCRATASSHLHPGARLRADLRLARGYPARLGESEGTKWWTAQPRTPGSPSRMMRRAFVFRWPLAHSCSAPLPIAPTPLPPCSWRSAGGFFPGPFVDRPGSRPSICASFPWPFPGQRLGTCGCALGYTPCIRSRSRCAPQCGHACTARR